MNKINIIMKNIKNNLYSSDEELLNKLIPLYKYLNKKIPRYKDFFVQEEKCEKVLLPLLFNNFDNKERIIFFIRSSLIKLDNDKIRFFDYFITVIFKNYIEENPTELLEIIKNNDNIQELYINWFKIKETNANFRSNFYSEIYNLPKFREIILEDEEFILNNLYSLDFYENLPREYGYLIGLKNIKNIPIKIVFKLYNKYFDNILNRNDQLKLLKTSILMDNTDYSFGIENKLKRLEYTHCLKKIYKNIEYYNILKKLSKKSKLNLGYIISFSDKYENTDFFINVCSKKKLTKNEIDKIKYLAISEKILNNNIINNLNNISLNDLINTEKEKSIEIDIYGGPNSKNSSNPLFSIDSSSKEIRRINVDGSIDIKKLTEYDSHSLGVDSIYPKIEFESDYKAYAVFEKAIIATKELDSITFVIEGEACLIVSSKHISDEQKKILINWISKSSKHSNIAINIYDKRTDKNEMLLCSEIGKKDTIKYINNLSNNEKKYTYNM